MFLVNKIQAFQYSHFEAIQRVGCYSGDMQNREAHLRKVGFDELLKKHGMEFDPRFVFWLGVAPTALGILFLLPHPDLTVWANFWRAYGAYLEKYRSGEGRDLYMPQRCTGPRQSVAHNDGAEEWHGDGGIHPGTRGFQMEAQWRSLGKSGWRGRKRMG